VRHARAESCDYDVTTRSDPSDIHQSLCRRLASVTKGEVKSAYDLAIMILDQCTKVFFDRLRPSDERPEVMDIFGSSISYVVSYIGKLLEIAAH
jgi:hypothetical protein